MSSGAGSGNSTTTQKVELPEWVNQAGQENYSAAKTLAATPFTPNPAQVAPQSADQLAAFDKIRALSGTGAGDYDTARTAIMQGGLLGGVKPITADQINADTARLFNPYTTAVVDPTTALMRQALGKQLGTIGASAGNVG